MITYKLDTFANMDGENQQADMSEEESAIDEMVYQLYGLTEEEISIVEGKG